MSLFKKVVLGYDLNAKKEPAMGRFGGRGRRHKGLEKGEILVSSKNERRVKGLQHTEPRVVVGDAMREKRGQLVEESVNWMCWVCSFSAPGEDFRHRRVLI